MKKTKIFKKNFFVVDTSILLKPLFQEKGMNIAEKILFLKDDFRISILVPDIFRYEFFNTVARRKNSKLALEAFETLTEKQISIIPLEIDIMNGASRLMDKYAGISFYDAAFHALAKAYGTFFVTADEKYLKTTKPEGDVMLLEDLKI